MNPLFDAWAAGILDGEGSIVIHRQGIYHSLLVTVGQSGHEQPEILTRLKDEYGGHLMGPRPHSLPGRKPIWKWNIQAAKAEAFLRRVAPYAVGKAEQVEIALEYRERAVGKTKRHLADGYRQRLVQVRG